MKPLNIVKKAIHTEKGVFDALPLLPALPKPNVPIINSDQTNLPEIPKPSSSSSSHNLPSTDPNGSIGRNRRAQTVWSKGSQIWDENGQETKGLRSSGSGSNDDKFEEELPDKPDDDKEDIKEKETQKNSNKTQNWISCD